MKKKLLAMMLTGAMAISVFAGCGQSDEKTNVESPSIAETTVTNTTEESKVEEPKEIRNVKWVLRGNQPEDHEKVIAAANEILNERYALNLELEPVANSEIAQRLELMITSGEAFDLAYTNAKTFNVNVEREAWLPLNDLLENTEIGQKLMEVYPEFLLDYGTVDGTIYALPNYQKIYTQYCAFVPKELADKYGLDPDAKYDTLEDMEPFMQKVLEGEENIWPLAVSRGSAFAYAFGKPVDILSNFCVDRDDADYKVIHVDEHETLINAKRKINEYFHKGYIREDVATVVDDSADLMAGRYAIYIGVHKPGGDVDHAAKYGGEYYMIPFGEPTLDYNGAIGTMTAINVASEDPEAALEMYYVMWTDPEVYNLLVFGLEGEHYTKVAEDRVEQPEGNKYNMAGTYGWQLGSQFNAWKMAGQSDDVWAVTEELNSSAEVSHLSGFSFSTADVQSEMAIYTSTNDQYALQYIYAEDFDAWLAESRKALKDSNEDIIIENIQKQVDAWRAANGK